MGCGTSFVKYVLFFFNLLFALVGLAMIGIGVAVLLNWTAIRDVVESGHLTVAPWLFIVIGSVVFIIAFFGCCGAIRESHCMIVTYAIFLLVIIIVQVALAVLLFAYSDNVKEKLVAPVNQLFDKRRDDSTASVAFDNIQEQFQCCGKNGPSDYTLFGTLPESCCPRYGTGVVASVTGHCNTVDAFKTGCVTTISTLYEKWNKTIAGVAIGVACVEVVGALFALCLANSIRNMDRRYA